MNPRTLLHNLALALALAVLSPIAQAALTIDRSVTITDEAGGTLVMLTTATHDALGGEGTTTATFSQFQPDPDRRRVDGEIVRNRVRSADAIETVFDGTLEIFTPSSQFGPERLDTLVFQNLTITRQGQGPILSGSVVFNGEEILAADLPRPARRLLVRTLRFFHFA